MTIDIVKHTRGLRVNIPILLDGQSAIVEDEGRLVIGTLAGNVDIPSQNDLNIVTATATSAVDTANIATTNIAQTLVVANLAKSTADGAMVQVANIITSNGTGKDTELVDVRTDSSSIVWVSAGDHVRNLDKIGVILKTIQVFTATANNTSIIPIAPSILSQVDITKIAIDVYDLGQLINNPDHYTIDNGAMTIVLNGWTLAIGEAIKYRVYK